MLALSNYLLTIGYKFLEILKYNTCHHFLKDELTKSIDRFIEFEIPCIIVAAGNKIPSHLVFAAKRRNICVFGSEHSTTTLVHLMSDFLDMTFAPQESVSCIIS